MTEIHATLLDSFNAGKWRVMRVTQPGSMPVQTKNGTYDMPFYPGDVLLAGEANNIICGPVSLDGARELAGRILDNDARAKTDPLAILILATAMAGFSGGGSEFQPDVPSIPPEAQDAGAVL